MTQRFWPRLLELLLPTRCVICQRVGAKVVCGRCLAGLERVGERHCTRCGRRRETEFASPDCGECFGQSLGFSRARSLYIYNDTGRTLLAEFKFRSRIGAGLALLEGLRGWLASGLAPLMGLPELQCAAVVPVPLHAARLATRRFNQSELIARHVARALSLPPPADLLRRTRDTPSQVGLSANQRVLNVRGAFEVPAVNAAQVKGKSVLLVDDLMTTGSTLAACARALRRAGSGPVCALTLFSTHYSAEL
jgi:ComF family protein